ncbi:hypothetical protein RCF19_30130 [Rhodococcus qingshengii]
MSSVLGIVRRMSEEEPTVEREQLRAELIESRHRNGFDIDWELHKEYELRDRIGNFGTPLSHLVPA